MNKVLFSHKSDEWETPQDLFNKLNDEFHFELDVCASHSNHKCPLYFTKLDMCLPNAWDNYRVWCNPPYSDIPFWVKRCSEHSALAVMLLPARTDTKWFHEYCYNKPNVEIRFIKGRLKFSNSKNSAPFPSMLVIFRRNNDCN